MREDSVHLLLCALFDWHLRMEMSGLPTTNVLYRVAREGSVTRSGQPGHRILAPDLTPDLRKCQLAFNSLCANDQNIVVVKHMPVPMDGDKPRYKKWGDREKALYIQEPMRVFKSRYRSALRKIKKNMSTR